VRACVYMCACAGTCWWVGICVRVGERALFKYNNSMRISVF